MYISFYCNSKTVLHNVKAVIDMYFSKVNKSFSIIEPSPIHNQKKRMKYDEEIRLIANHTHKSVNHTSNNIQMPHIRITTLVYLTIGTRIIQTHNIDVLSKIMGRRMNLISTTIIETENKIMSEMSKIIIKTRLLNGKDMQTISHCMDFSDSAFVLQPAFQPYVNYISSYEGTSGTHIRKIFNILQNHLTINS